MSALKEMGEEYNSKRIYVGFSVGKYEKDASLTRKKIGSAIKSLLSLIDDENSPIDGLSVKAKDDTESPQEIIDFISERLTYEREVRVNPGDLRVDRKVRYSVLNEAHNEWEKLLSAE